MATPTQKLNDWIEYKMLVLAELERLNDCVDRLQASQNTTNGQIADLKRDHKEAMTAISAVDKKFDGLRPMIPEAKWKFYAAVITLIATAVAAFASLITVLWQHTHSVTP